MRILFLGLPLAALLLAADGHQIVLAGVRRGLTTGARRLGHQIGPDQIWIDPQRRWADFAQSARQARPDLLVSWFFTRKIPVSLCQQCPLGGIGVHPSLLPRHRGPDPFFWAIERGDTISGVTAHRIAADYDTGAILAQQRLAIDPSWNAWQLARALDRPSLQLLRQTVARLARGEAIADQAQDETAATLAPSPDDALRDLHWDQPAERIVRRIRALAPVPGAVITVGDHELVVMRASLEPNPLQALVAGEAAVLDNKVVVRAADQGVALLDVELDGHRLEPSELAMLFSQAKGQTVLT